MSMTALLFAFLAIQECDRVHADSATGEITLAGRNSTLREHSDPSKFDVTTEMTVYRGRLIAACCMDFDDSSIYPAAAYSTEADLLEYSPERDEWTTLRHMDASMVFNMRVIGDTLYVPEYFPFNGRSRMVHTFDGKEWGCLGLLPDEAWHIMDVIRIGDTFYASGSWRDLDPEKRKSDPDWWKGYGHVHMSKDGGKTWTDIRRSREVGRCLDMVEFRGKLYCNERGYQLIAWDGQKWEEVPVRFENSKVDAKLGSAHLAVVGDRILAINADLYYAFDGKTWKSHQPGFIDLWKDGTKLYGLRKDGSVALTDDGAKWTPVTKEKEGVPAKEFDRLAPKGRPLNRGAVTLHRGRLWVGTSATGKLYAAPYEEKGSYSSKPEKVEVGAKVTLTWEQAGIVRLRVRTAETSDDLSKGAWKDVASSPASITLGKKHVWVQWRADFESDGRKTPVLRGARLIFD